MANISPSPSFHQDVSTPHLHPGLTAWFRPLDNSQWNVATSQASTFIPRHGLWTWVTLAQAWIMIIDGSLFRKLNRCLRMQCTQWILRSINSTLATQGQPMLKIHCSSQISPHSGSSWPETTSDSAKLHCCSVGCAITLCGKTACTRRTNVEASNGNSMNWKNSLPGKRTIGPAHKCRPLTVAKFSRSKGRRIMQKGVYSILQSDIACSNLHCNWSSISQTHLSKYARS